jgi:Outer membrane protein beta-barrel domain
VKITNRIFGIVFFIFITPNIFSQTIGIKAGLNLSKITTAYEPDLNGVFNYKPGIHAGLTTNFTFSEVFGLETGVILSSKGTKYYERIEYFDPFTFTTSIVELNETTSLLYLDIPLTIKATSQIGKLKIFTTFGPYIGFGLSGKDKIEFTGSGINEKDERTIKWGTGFSNDFKKLEGGLLAGIGVDFKPVQVSVSYDFGVLNIVSVSDKELQTKNRVIGLSLAYLFGKK